MTIPRLITKSDTKRACAAALSEAKARRRWSNTDLGAAMDASEGTARNRQDGDDPKEQMTVHELVRLIAAGEEVTVNHLLRDLVGYHLQPDSGAGAVGALEAAQHCATRAAELIAAAADGVIDSDEARSLIPGMVELQAELCGLEARFREIASARPVARIRA